MIFVSSIPLFIFIILIVAILTATVFCLIKKKYRKAYIFRRIGIAALLVIALARPAIGTDTAERNLSNLNVHFVVDNTGSMATKDMNGKYRYEVASEDMQKIVKLFAGSRFSITTMDYNIYQAMPLVNDSTTASSFINSLSPKNSLLTMDSDLSSLLKYSYTRIKKYAKRFPERANILIVMTDGEDDKNSTSIPSDLSSLVAGGAIIGYGSLNGGEVHQVDCNNKVTRSTITDPATGAPHISKLNETNLTTIANKLGLPYYRRISSSDKFDSINSFSSPSITYKKSDKTAHVSAELYWIPMIAAFAILMYDFSAVLGVILLEREVVK